MSDMISRQAVLKLLSTMPPEEAITKAMLIQNVKYMSAAQPDGPDNLVKDSQGLAKELVNDCISRKAAIDAVSDCGICIQRIVDLPSAQPDSLVRPSARWMSVGHKRARICSHCFRDEPYKFADHDADIYDFCPHCGAKMEVNDERSD